MYSISLRSPVCHSWQFWVYTETAYSSRIFPGASLDSPPLELSDLLLLGAGLSHCVPAQLAEHLRAVKRGQKKHYGGKRKTEDEDHFHSFMMWGTNATVNRMASKKRLGKEKRKKKGRDEAGTTSHRLISVLTGSGGRDAHDPRLEVISNFNTIDADGSVKHGWFGGCGWMMTGWN